jgi:hypothetical protein
MNAKCDACRNPQLDHMPTASISRGPRTCGQFHYSWFVLKQTTDGVRREMPLHCQFGRCVVLIFRDGLPNGIINRVFFGSLRAEVPSLVNGNYVCCHWRFAVGIPTDTRFKLGSASTRRVRRPHGKTVQGSRRADLGSRSRQSWFVSSDSYDEALGLEGIQVAELVKNSAVVTELKIARSDVCTTPVLQKCN